MENDHDLPATADSLPIALLRAREVLMIPIREMLAESGLTEQQWRILRVLGESGPMDASAVAERAALSAPSLSRILPALESRGMVTRSGDPGDRRRQVVALGDSGCSVLEANRARAQALADLSRKRLGEDKYRALLQILGEMKDWGQGS